MATITSNQVTVQVTAPLPVTSPTSPTSTTGSGTLGIYNYNVSYTCSSPGMDYVSGIVVGSNGPVQQNVEVNVGFCSQFDFNTNQFTGTYITTTTAYDGTFLTALNTNTPSGGSDCIVAMVNHNNQTAVAQQSIIIPQCCTGSETPTFNITVTVNGNGTVSPMSAVLKPDQFVTFTAYPAYSSGYVLGGWILYVGGYTKAYPNNGLNSLTLTYDDVFTVFQASANKTCDVTLFAQFVVLRLNPIKEV